MRSLASEESWTGEALHLDVPMPAGEDAAVLVHAADGRIVGAARVAGGAP